MIEKYLNIISKSPLFYNIHQDDIEMMMPCLNPNIVKYDKNDYVKLIGDPMDSFGIVLEGGVTVSQENEAGNRIIVANIKSGDMFGEMLAFANKKQWLVTVQAQFDSVIIFLPNERLISQCHSSCLWHKKLIQNMLTIISRKAIYLNKRVEYMSIKSIRGKLAKYFLEQYKLNDKKVFTIPLNRNELADFLNVSRPSMSREMSKLRDNKIIDFHLSTIRIIDVDSLKSIMIG